ncbi:MAG: hypothetical protein JO199_07140, partial [Candidatus Eremiobacteraeota bacterium]|nr:hypothetical protein [Candidatus Eremiobacteraeota bacterium]
MTIESVDVRSYATPGFVPALERIPSGVETLYGVAFGSPEFARRDAADIAAPSLKGPAHAIPGRRFAGSLWPGQRYALRIPDRWNGRLVVAGCPGQRTEFACDSLFGDPLLERGYAYIAGNKGNGDGTALLDRGASLEIDGAVLPR